MVEHRCGLYAKPRRSRALLPVQRADVVKALERVERMYGFPRMIRVDRGTELVSKDWNFWGNTRGLAALLHRGLQVPSRVSERALIDGARETERTGSAASWEQRRYLPKKSNRPRGTPRGVQRLSARWPK